jgi:hypothetical protein
MCVLPCCGAAMLQGWARGCFCLKAKAGTQGVHKAQLEHQRGERANFPMPLTLEGWVTVKGNTKHGGPAAGSEGGWEA